GQAGDKHGRVAGGAARARVRDLRLFRSHGAARTLGRGHASFGQHRREANANMTANAPTFATLFLRVFLPFAFAYFLSYIFRGVNAVIFPYLERDIGITAGDLGLLTSAFFLFFAGCQPVLGVMLDRYGPRRGPAPPPPVAAAGPAVVRAGPSPGP